MRRERGRVVDHVRWRCGRRSRTGRPRAARTPRGPAMSTRIDLGVRHAAGDRRCRPGRAHAPVALSYALLPEVTPPKSGRPCTLALARLSRPSRRDDDLGGHRLHAGGRVGAGARALDGEVADPPGRVEHLLQRGVGLVEPALRVGDVARLLRGGRLLGTRLHRPVGAGRRVRRRVDQPAGGELLLQLADGVEVAVEPLEAGERDSALGDPHSAHRPTRPVRLISDVQRLVDGGDQPARRRVRVLELTACWSSPRRG